MTFEIKKYYIFLIFLFLHLIFWGNVDGELTTYILGDWMDIWRNITQLENYLYLHPYARIFYTIETYTGFSLYFGMVFFSIVNTLLIVALIKTFDVFNKKYSTLAVILLLLMPSTIPSLLSMYKDNLSYLAFALILLVIARSFSDKPLSLIKTIVLYLVGIYLTVYSREVYIYYITALLGLGLLFSFFLRLRQPLSYSKSFPLLVIFILHIGYFYGGFYLEKLETSENTTDLYLEKLETSENTTDLMALQEKILSNTSWITGELNANQLEMLKIKYEADSNLKGDIVRQLSWFPQHIKERKRIIMPGSLNYNDQSTKDQSDVMLLLSHLPKAIFAPNILLIKNINTNGFLKAIFLFETLVNYILALSVLYFFIRSKPYEKFFVITLFICMYITVLLDTNYGTYLRHSLVFSKLFLGLGLLNLLYILKLDINFNMRKGLL